jgi:hypothetical protein
MTAPAEKPPGKISQWVSAILGFPRRLSTAARAAIVLEIFLCLVVFTVWIAFLTDRNNVPWRHSLTIERILVVLLLLLIIPLVFYRAVRLWTEGDRSQFPDLDYAWTAGLASLSEHGLSLESIPVFLVLGSANEAQEKALMTASGMGFRVRGIPEGPAPVHWYANVERIYLFCSEASWLSGLASKVDRRIRRNLAATSMSSDRPVVNYTASSPVAQLSDITRPVPRDLAPAGDLGIKTISVEEFSLTPPGGPRSSPAPAPSAPAVHAPISPTPTPRVNLMESSAVDMSLAGDEPVAMLPHESAEQLRRLQYFCRLLQRARQPLCATNGILVLLPSAMLQARQQDVEELQKAVKSDLTMSLRTLQIRCPVTTLITGMEREPGFGELVRRVGRDRAQAQRFGRRFDTRHLPTGTALTSLSAHLCGAFEDWIYTLFREDGALTRPGNTRLFGLLCKVRTNLKSRLAALLTAAVGYEAAAGHVDDPILYSGCYFAATGETEDRQAFIKGVFDKLNDEQEDVEWSHDSLRSNRRYRRSMIIGIGVCVLLSGTLATLIGYALLH